MIDKQTVVVDDDLLNKALGTQIKNMILEGKVPLKRAREIVDRIIAQRGDQPNDLTNKK